MASDWGYSTATHSRGTAGTASTVVLAANASRKYLFIRNELGGPVYLNLGGAATVDNGSVRMAGAGTVGSDYEMTKGRGNIYTGSVTAICSGATALLDIIEGT